VNCGFAALFAEKLCFSGWMRKCFLRLRRRMLSKLAA
jgi:hypothetical protein